MTDEARPINQNHVSRVSNCSPARQDYRYSLLMNPRRRLFFGSELDFRYSINLFSLIHHILGPSSQSLVFSLFVLPITTIHHLKYFRNDAVTSLQYTSTNASIVTPRCCFEEEPSASNCSYHGRQRKRGPAF